MREAKRTWPAHPVLSKPLTICGVERKLFILSGLLGWSVFRVADLVAGLVLFAGLYAAGLVATRRDPQLIEIVRKNVEARRRYDPGLPPTKLRVIV